MATDRVLLFTDIEGSTQLTERLGDVAASSLWTAHDRIARHLMRTWDGREIDKSDGFLLLFESVANAVGFATSLHAALAELQPPLRARAGIHSGAMVARENTPEDVSLGAKPLELDGVGKAIASRIMSIARGGQTLLSASARAALSDQRWKVQSHGHWRMKGVADPIDLFEAGDSTHFFVAPGDSEKAFRVTRHRGVWTCVAELPHSLPGERDPFVGRDDALGGLCKIVQEDRRLVTILGIGGIGKTRLAIRYAHTWLGAYPGGAWFCDLASATTIDGIVLATAQGLDMPLGNADPIQQIGAAIAGRGACLVVLDNFEQVARHAEATVGEWLKRAPKARFIVTSREVLGIVGEETFVLAPLPSADAVSLFEIRAKAAHQTSVNEASDRAAIATLVELLDRLPLAIELAAARVRVMTPRVMLERMNQRFKLLASTGGRRERQATLRATLDWSWDLLSKAERSALAQLSAFEGGFVLEAAEAVVELRSLTDDVPWIPDVVQGLVEKSLLRNRDGRFDMLRSVQEYAAERLAGSGPELLGESTASHAYQRHWRYFASLDESAATAQRCVETENLIVACRRASASDASAAVGALLGASACLQLIGPFRVVLDLVALVEGSGPLTIGQQVIVDRVAGAALFFLGEGQPAIERCESGLRRAAEVGDMSSLARIKCLLALLDMSRGDYKGALTQLDEAMALSSDPDDVRARVRVLSAMGALHQRTGKLALAAESYEQAMSLAAALGDKRWQGGLHGNLGAIAQVQGREEDARWHLEKGIGFACETGDRQREGNNRCNLGLLLLQLGQLKAAKAELDSSLVIAQSVGYRRLEALVLCNLGNVTEALGDRDESARWYAEAIALGRALGDFGLEAQAGGYLALLLARLDRHSESDECFVRALTAATQAGDSLTLCLVHCQQAIAAKERADEPSRRESFDRANALLEPEWLQGNYELRLAYESARDSGG